MSRLSILARKVRLGPVVTKTVRQVEELFGRGNGALKKKAVTEGVMAILRRLKELDLPIPDDVEERIDELIEQAVYILNDTEWSDALQGGPVVTQRIVEAPQKTSAVAATAEVKRRGRKPGSKNKPKEAPQVTPTPPPYEEVTPPVDEFDIDGIDLDVD